MKRVLSATVIASMLVGLLPASARAAEETGAAGPARVDLHGSIDRIAAKLAAERPRVGPIVSEFRHDDAGTGAAASAQNNNAGGGGGATGVIVWTLVSAAIGIGTTYYVMKQIRKQTNTTPQ